MCSLLVNALATAIPTVPDSGSTGFLMGLGVLSLGLVARFLKNRKR